MFTIIGGDGQEYGPVSSQQLRSWIAAGRANMDTQAKLVGTDEWQRLGDFPEFTASAEPPPIIAAAHDDVTLASRWRRLVGAMADGGLEALCWIPTSSAMAQTMADMVNDGAFEPDQFMTAFRESINLSLPYLVPLLVLQVVLLSLRGQSVGNMLVGTRIVRAPGGERVGFVRAFLLRGFLARVIRQLPLIGGIFWVVDSCFIFRDDRRCLHDLIAGTKVINTRVHSP
jgi:uncharacterized RDD family membrane protein YckC